MSRRHFGMTGVDDTKRDDWRFASLSGVVEQVIVLNCQLSAVLVSSMRKPLPPTRRNCF
jgi:hypothetical protein